MSGLLQDIELIGDNIPWLKEARQKGREAFLAQGIPTPKTEAWKYTKPNRFFEREFTCAPKGIRAEIRLPEIPFACYKVCFENGVFTPKDSELPDGIEIVPLIEAVMFRPEIRAHIGNLAQVENHPFAALNMAYLEEGIYIRVPQGYRLDRPIALIYHTNVPKDNLMYNVRNLVVVEPEAELELVEYFGWKGAQKASYFTNIVNEIEIKTGGVLRHYKVQDEAFKAAHIALNAVSIGQNGKYKSFCLQKGADLGRHETKVLLAEEGAETQVDAAYMMNGWATLDTTTDIEHQKPNTKSLLLVKGVVGGQAKGVFQGKIHIEPDAVKTEGYQLHKAMLLSDEAEIDVKPELEIFADDVKCSHGAACGQLDKEQLFYMRSRGIGEKKAEQLLIDAYLNDVIAKIDDEKVNLWIKSLVKTIGTEPSRGENNV